MARQKKLKEEKLSKSDKEDLRVYLTEIIVAGRWLKERQLSFTLYASALEASLLTGEFKSALRGESSLVPSVWTKFKYQQLGYLFSFVFLLGLTGKALSKQESGRKHYIISSLLI